MANVYVDHKPYQMNPEENLLQGCLSQGFRLPYFCWHPALGSVGACRQCAVKQYKDEHDEHGKIIMSCLTPAKEGTRTSIEDPEVTAFRAGIIEGLMLNHPHDCAVCDEGGECHLQDMTVMTGHNYRRYAFEKRTFRNQNLGPLVNHEMNRCIQCYRCVRYYRDYAGGGDLNAFAIRNTVFFGRHEDGVLENEFSGNLVEICPTGVFTDKTLKRHYARKWDQQFAPSVCVHCALGCNTDSGERYGTLRRIVNRYNHEVNGYFLCDRGRFGYEFVNSDRRLLQPVLKGRPASAALAQGHLSERIANGRVIGIGSPRASLEANFALRTLVGPDRFHSGVPDDQAELVGEMIDILQKGPMRTPTLREIEECDAVFILGEDVTNVAPRMALAVRQSVRQQPMEVAKGLNIPFWMDHGVRDALQTAKGPLYIATPRATRLDDIATATFHAAPDDLARLGFAVAHAVDSSAPSPGDFPLAGEIALALKAAKRPLVISGTSCASQAVIHAASNVAMSAHAALSFTVPECNTMGAALMGGNPLSAAFEAVRDGRADTVIVLENDLYRRAPAAEVDSFLKAAKHVIVLDHLANPTTAKAELILPAGTFAESDGTFVSSEGRVQRFFQVFAPRNDVSASWRWLKPDQWRNLDDVLAAMVAAFPQLAAVRSTAPSASFRVAGAKIPRSPLRESGRTAMLVNIDVSEPKPPDDPDSPLSFSMEGTPEKPPAALIPFFWSPGWNSIQATNTYQAEVGGPLRGGDAGVRLFEPAERNGRAYFDTIPSAFAPRDGEWLLLPMFHIFGSEELSASAQGIAQLVPEPHAAVNAADFPEGEEVDGDLRGWEFAVARSGPPQSSTWDCLCVCRNAGVGGILLAGLGKAREATMTSPHPILSILGMVVVALTIAGSLIWVERRLLALWQDRYGPNRVGPFGLLQVMADAIKIFTKEDWIPPFADKFVFVAAPAVVFVTVLMSFAVLPVAPGIIVSDLNIGLLFFLAMSSLGVYSIVLAGWSSDNKYALLGGLRAAAQMLSYEVFMGLSQMGVVVLAGSFSLPAIVEAQKKVWFVIPQFPGFVLFLIAGLAETRRIPFDLAEAESELVAGYHSEYSGMKFGMFFVGEYMGITLISAMIAVLFFGGWLGPVLPGLLWLLIKTFFFISFFVLLRAALPRPRFDQLMSFGWKVMLPLALANVLLAGAAVLIWS